MVPIIPNKISPGSTLDLLLISLKSCSEINEQSEKSILPPFKFFDVTNGKPSL